MSSGIVIYFEGIKVAFKRRLAYRVDYVVSFLGMMIAEIFAPVITLLIYSNSSGIAGWSVYNLLLLQGIFMMAKGISWPFFGGMLWRTIIVMQDGTFDLYLLKPTHPIFTLIYNSFDAEDLGVLTSGIITTVYAAINLELANIWYWLSALPWFLLGIIIIFNFMLLASAFTIRFVQTWRVYEVLEVIWLFGLYPLHIYGRFISVILIFVFPVAFIAYYPSSALLGNAVPSLILCAVLIGILTSFVYFIWMQSLKKYSSAGG